MNGRFLVVCASRDRNLSLLRMIGTVLATSELADVAVYVDEDQRYDYAMVEASSRVLKLTGPQVGPCKSLNALIERFPDYEAYGAATDDCEFLTKGWDQWALKTARSFPGGVGAFHPWLEHAHHGQRMDFPWITQGWYKALGWMCHPGAFHFYWDILIEILAEQTDSIARAQFHEFAVEHVGQETPDVHVKSVTDARNLVPVFGIERPVLIQRLKEAQRATVGSA